MRWNPQQPSPMPHDRYTDVYSRVSVARPLGE